LRRADLISHQFKREFFEILSILKDYLSDIVIAGGWAPLIYDHYLLSDKSRVPLRTIDIDIVVPEHLKKRKDKTVDAILTEVGFKTCFKSRHTPPVISYEGTFGEFEVEIEFLTHRRGARKGQVAVVQEGLHAQILRFINVLLENSINVEIDDFKLEGNKLLRVRVPTPGAFVFQKGLTFVRRAKHVKKAKDLYYIFDLLSNRDELHEQIIKDISSFRESYPVNWTKQFKRNFKTYFSDEDAEGVLMVRSQRPESAFSEMNDEQFSQYVLGIFQEFLCSI
jgi:hypothetical protein